jgi:Ca2+-binding RTX toxin-like protein
VTLARLILSLLLLAGALALAPIASAGGTDATITIAPQGPGSGNVVGDGSVSGANIISCGWNGASSSGTCTFDSGGVQSIQLAATAAAGSDFITWTNCPGVVSSGGTVCTFTVDDPSDDVTIQPRFELEDTEALVTVIPEGPGTGSVAGNGSVSGPGIINCAWNGAVASGTCSFGSGGIQSIQLSASANAGSAAAWTSCPGTLSGGGLICTFTVDDPSDDFIVRPRFELVNMHAVTVTGNGSGNGTITGPGFNCTSTAGVESGDCAENVLASANLTLTATALAGSTFAGSWGGACAPFGSNATCTLTITAATAVSATFTLSGGGGGGGGGGGECDIVGTPGNDVLVGTAADEVICGLAGNDVIRGGGGDDVVKGQLGNDTLYGQGGSDELQGGKGRDTLYGANGPDTLLGGAGNDRLFGGAGPDFLNGKTGSDFGNGGGGGDTCRGLEVRVSCP